MKEQVQTRHGWYRIAISLLSLSVAICNLLLTRQKGFSYSYTIMMWLPFIVIGIAVYFVELKALLFISCLFVAVTITIDQQNKSDLQGILFFILALNIYSDKISLTVVMFSALTGILGRAFLIGMSFTETTILTIGFFACFLIFYIPKIIKGDEDV